MNVYNRFITEMKASLKLESNYFNMENGSFEPIIEPWELTATMRQRVKSSPLLISIESEKLLNMNLTHGMALIIKLILTKIEQTSDDWVDEEAIRLKKRLTSLKSLKRQTESPIKAIAHHMIDMERNKKEREEKES
jgi:hypothetical protein